MADNKPITEASPRHQPVRPKFLRLPWLVGAAALLVYAATLCHGLSLQNLPLAAEVAGWASSPQPDHPLLWLLTAPLRVLPGDWIPVALNLQSACFAALTLVLLARSVQLLPLNRLRLQRLFMSRSSHSKAGVFRRGDAWLPPVLAAVLCGLDLGFWREAVTASGETLDTLLLAAALWMIVEFRTSGEMRWLDRLALLWGIGMAENWGMIAAWPLMVAAVIWQLGLASVSLLLWVRYAARWALGFLLFFLLPLVNGLGPGAVWTFPHALNESALALIKPMEFAWGAYSHSIEITAVAALFFVLPVLPMVFRLKDEGSYHSSLQARIQLVTLQLMFAAGLATELWVALHPVVGPQNILTRYHLLTTTLLSLVLLNALGAGYLTAHFLLICGANEAVLRRHDRSFRWPPFLPPWLRRAATLGLFALPVAFSLLLANRNFGVIRDLNRVPLLRYGELAVSTLPASGGGVLMGDDPLRLEVVQAALTRHPGQHPWLPVDTTRLADPLYRAALQRNKPLGWTDISPRRALTYPEIAELIDHVVHSSTPVYYVHPSFGFFFENADAEPHGLVFKLHPASDRSAIPSPAPPLVRENEQFWDRTWAGGLSALPVPAPAPAQTPADDFSTRFIRLFQLTEPVSDQRIVLDHWFSMALNTWGVSLQRVSQWAAARQRFQQSLALNTNNIAARLNLDCNVNLQKGGRMEAATAYILMQQLKSSHYAAQELLRANGPFDDPVMTFELGLHFQSVSLTRQAGELFRRTSELAPGEVIPELTLAELYIQDRQPGPALAVLANVRRQAATKPLDEDNATRLTLLEAAAWLDTTNRGVGDRLLRAAFQNRAGDQRTLNTVIEIYEQAGQLTNALELVQDRLQDSPADVQLLTRLAGLQQKAGQYAKALETINRTLSLALTDIPTLRLDRATDRLMTGDLAGAEAEYRQLMDAPVEKWRPCYGLAQVALRRHNPATARQWLQTGLEYAAPGSSTAALLTAALRELPPAHPSSIPKKTL